MLQREVRRCPLSGRTVALTWGRLPPVRPATLPAGCGLCGDERPALWREGGVRVLPDRRPVLGIEGPLAPGDDGLFESMNGLGAHEVIAVGETCGLHPGDLGAALVAGALRAGRDRMVDLRGDRRLAAMSWSWNYGVEAGARSPHPHAQLIATPVVPDVLSQGGRLHARYRGRHGICPSCALVARELADRTRVVIAGERAVAVAAWAPRVPFELHLLPRAHQPGLEHADDALIAEVGGALDALLSALGVALDGCALSCHLATLPGEPDFHWRITIQPRLEAAGGFQDLTGWASHGVWPEEAAAWLRRLL